jgi:hypothetical protein
MTHSNHTKSHALLYLFSGLFAGIVLGFGAALLLQNYSLTDMVPLFRSDQDTAGVEPGRMSATSREKSSGMNRDAAVSGNPTMSELRGEESSGSADDSLLSINDKGVGTILRDEFIGSRKVKLNEADNQPGKGGTQGSDSLLTSLTGARGNNESFREYSLEFWQNPINYKGYKIVRDHIILYGLSPDQVYKLYMTDDGLILQNAHFQFLLRESDDFLPLVQKK